MYQNYLQTELNEIVRKSPGTRWAEEPLPHTLSATDSASKDSVLPHKTASRGSQVQATNQVSMPTVLIRKIEANTFMAGLHTDGQPFISAHSQPILL